MARTPWAGARGRGRQGGSALVEFALVLPLLLVLTVAVLDFGRAFLVMDALGRSAREGARLLAAGSIADSALVRRHVLQVANASGVTVRGLALSGPDAARQLRVVVRGEFHWVFPGVRRLLGAGFADPVTLTGRAVQREA